MEPLFSGQLVGILSAALGILVIAYMRQDKKVEKDQDSVVEAYLVDIGNATNREEYRINKSVTTIGRSRGKDVDMCIAQNTVSESHAQIEYRNGNFYITDLRSRNGTYLNNEKERTSGSVYLKDGDTITFDKYMFRFIVPKKKKERITQPDRKSYNHTIMRAPIE